VIARGCAPTLAFALALALVAAGEASAAPPVPAAPAAAPPAAAPSAAGAGVASAPSPAEAAAGGTAPSIAPHPSVQGTELTNVELSDAGRRSWRSWMNSAPPITACSCCGRSAVLVHDWRKRW